MNIHEIRAMDEQDRNEVLAKTSLSELADHIGKKETRQLIGESLERRYVRRLITNEFDATAIAEFFGCCKFHFDRGVYDCGDIVVLFGNDGYGTAETSHIDNRSHREVELITGKLTALGITDAVFGLTSNCISWVLVIQNHQHRQFARGTLEKMMDDSWYQACDEHKSKAASDRSHEQ